VPLLCKINSHANKAERGGIPPYTLDLPVVEGKAMEYIIHLLAAPAKQR